MQNKKITKITPLKKDTRKAIGRLETVFFTLNNQQNRLPFQLSWH